MPFDDPILYWNAVALDCNKRDHTGAMQARNQRGPTLSSRAMAMVHIAIHDAYVGVVRPATGQQQYLASPPVLPPSISALSSPEVQDAAAIAVAGAACVALMNLYPDCIVVIREALQKFAPSGSGFSVNAAQNDAHRYGIEIGRAVLDLRSDDGVPSEAEEVYPDYIESQGYGAHRDDPLNPAIAPHGVHYGEVRHFGIAATPPLNPPPAFGTADYNNDHDEVMKYGATASNPRCMRTPDQTVIGVYWAYDGVKNIGTPPRMYNQVLRVISKSKALTTLENARLFFLANLAMGDAGIAAWHWKFHYDLWRPVVGIREFDGSMGPGANAGANTIAATPQRCDPFWRPLGAPKTNSTDEKIRTFTPPFPAYPSGHATFGAAAFHAARKYLSSIGKGTLNSDGTDNIGFEFVSDEMNGNSVDPDDTVRARHLRKYDGLHQAIFENSISRIYLGVHWRFDGTSASNEDGAKAAVTATDKIGGVPLGVAIAEEIFAKFSSGSLVPTLVAPSVAAAAVRASAANSAKAARAGERRARRSKK